MSLQNYVRLQTLLQVYVIRHPELIEPSKLFCDVIALFNPDVNFGLARHYVSFVTRYRKCLFNIPFTKDEFNLLDEILIDLELEIVLALCEAKAYRTHNPN